MKTVLYIVCQCTWGILQTTLGFIVFLIHFRGKHYMYRGAVTTEWKNRGGVSLGLFVFVAAETNDDKEKRGNDASSAKRSERLLIHEYGHTLQSLMLGPLYLVVVGIPSAMWAGLPYFRKKRRTERISYYSFYTERWADRLGERTAGKSY